MSRGNPSNSEKNMFQSHLFLHKSHFSHLGMKKTALWDIALSLKETGISKVHTSPIIHHPDDKESTHLWNVGLHQRDYEAPSVVIEWLAPMIRFREVMSDSFHGFPESLQANFGLVPSSHNTFLPHTFQFMIHVSSYYSTLYSLSYW
jgi:hypothetical protein